MPARSERRPRTRGQGIAAPFGEQVSRAGSGALLAQRRPDNGVHLSAQRLPLRDDRLHATGFRGVGQRALARQVGDEPLDQPVHVGLGASVKALPLNPGHGRIVGEGLEQGRAAFGQVLPGPGGLPPAASRRPGRGPHRRRQQRRQRRQQQNPAPGSHRRLRPSLLERRSESPKRRSRRGGKRSSGTRKAVAKDQIAALKPVDDSQRSHPAEYRVEHVLDPLLPDDHGVRRLTCRMPSTSKVGGRPERFDQGEAGIAQHLERQVQALSAISRWYAVLWVLMP